MKAAALPTLFSSLAHSRLLVAAPNTAPVRNHIGKSCQIRRIACHNLQTGVSRSHSANQERRAWHMPPLSITIQRETPPPPPVTKAVIELDKKEMIALRTILYFVRGPLRALLEGLDAKLRTNLDREMPDVKRNVPNNWRITPVYRGDGTLKYVRGEARRGNTLV